MRRAARLTASGSDRSARSKRSPGRNPAGGVRPSVRIGPGSEAVSCSASAWPTVPDAPVITRARGLVMADDPAGEGVEVDGDQPQRQTEEAQELPDAVLLDFVVVLQHVEVGGDRLGLLQYLADQRGDARIGVARAGDVSERRVIAGQFLGPGVVGLAGGQDRGGMVVDAFR